MKKYILPIVTLFFVVLSASAQQHKVRVEAGVNFPVKIDRYGYTSNKLGLFLGGQYQYNDNLFFGASLNYERYSCDKPYNENIIMVYETHSISFIPSVDYFVDVKTSFIKPFVGLGAGVSFDKMGNKRFSKETTDCHAVLAPRIGVRLWNHLDVFGRYAVTHKDYDRLTIGIGYVF